MKSPVFADRTLGSVNIDFFVRVIRFNAINGEGGLFDELFQRLKVVRASTRMFFGVTI